MFKSDQFLTAWNEWKEHLIEKTSMPYTSVSERKALSSLFKKCDGREQLAIDSINHSMEKNWAAIYIKPQDNGNGQNNGSSQSNSGKQGGASDSKMEAFRNW